MTVKHDCSEKAYHSLGNWGQWDPCSRNATVERDGKWYCWQHDPEYVAKKAAEHRAAWKAKGDREAAKYARIARNARLGALVTSELPALLERLACFPVRGIITAEDAKAARALAARIREALDDSQA